jgi:hypothetical protein
LRWRCVVEGRPSAFPAVGAERELRHDQHRSTAFNDGTVHAVVLIWEDAKVADLGGDVVDVCRAIRVGDADEHEQACADPSGHPPVRRDLGGSNTLDDSAHPVRT